MSDREIEVKYYINNLREIETRLTGFEAVCLQPRTREVNLRFDTPDHSLSKAGQALRLRHDIESRLTYKGRGQTDEGVHSRQEIEFVVGDFQAAKTFLELLGYEIFVIYEKFRALYELDGAHITLDELPYGSFIEIEGANPQAIQAMSLKLGLNWEVRILDSYIVIFDQLCDDKGWTMRDLIFENFTEHRLTAQDLKLIPADA